MRKIAIIGGSGVEDPAVLKGFRDEVFETPFGQAKGSVGEIAGNQVVFLSRHGVTHNVPPHKVNYRANIWALKNLGTEEIFATFAVGSLRRNILPGEFVVCDDMLDFTKSRINTFFNGENGLVVHADFTHPYCPAMRQQIMQCLDKLGYVYHRTGTYVTTEGPRFETAAEVRMYGMLGGDVVGMTGFPEAYLAREAEMCYAGVAMVSNLGAGLTEKPLKHYEVLAAMSEVTRKIGQLILAYIKDDTEPIPCICHEAIKDFGGFQLEAWNEDCGLRGNEE